MPRSAAASRRTLPGPLKALLGVLVAAGLLGGAEAAMRGAWGPPPPAPDLVSVSVATLVDEGASMRLSHPVDPRQDRTVSKAVTLQKRVLVLGGSAVHHAWTLPEEQNFPLWLDRALPDVDVVNLGGPGQQTGGLAVLAGQTAPLSPDLLVVYTGHNDFSRVVFHGDVAAPQLALVPVLQALSQSWIFTRLRTHTQPLVSERGGRRSVVLTTTDERALRLRRDALAAYRRGLEAIADAAPAPVLFLTQLRNADSPPTGVVAEAGSPCAMAAFRLRPGDLRRPDREHAAIEHVCGSDSALTWWLAAQAARQAKDPVGAREAFERSLDLDPLPMRAPAAADAVIAEAAAASGAGFLDLAMVLDPVPPGSWFEDTLHPSPAGARVLGEALAPHVQAALDGRMPGGG